MFGLLQRTKTSGPSKKVLILPIFVSEDAYVAQPWLDIGLLLWTEADLAFARDYFLPLPNADCSGVLKQRALYSDSAGFSRALMGTLTADDGDALLSPLRSGLRREHLFSFLSGG